MGLLRDGSRAGRVVVCPRIGARSTTQPERPHPMSKPRTTAAAAALLLAVLITGCAGGSATPAPTSAAADPAPTVTVTETAAPAAAGVPQSCLDALDAAEAGLAIAAQLQGEFGDIMGGPVSDAFLAASTDDAAGLAAATEGLTDGLDRVTALGDQLDADAYNTAAAACRSAA